MVRDDWSATSGMHGQKSQLSSTFPTTKTIPCTRTFNDTMCLRRSPTASDHMETRVAFQLSGLSGPTSQFLNGTHEFSETGSGQNGPAH